MSIIQFKLAPGVIEQNFNLPPLFAPECLGVNMKDMYKAGYRKMFRVRYSVVYKGRTLGPSSFNPFPYELDWTYFYNKYRINK